MRFIFSRPDNYDLTPFKLDSMKTGPIRVA